MTHAEFEAASRQYAMMMRGSQTSGLRTAKRNKEVGGVGHSAHRYGFAMDVVYDDLTMLRADHPLYPDAVRIETAARLGLKLLAERDHDHLQPLDWKAG